MDLTAIYKSIPAGDNEAAEQIGKQLVAGGPATVEQLVSSLGEKFGDTKGVMPTYALHALVVYAGRPGADTERQMVAETLAKQLDAKHSSDVQVVHYHPAPVVRAEGRNPGAGQVPDRRTPVRAGNPGPAGHPWRSGTGGPPAQHCRRRKASAE